MLSVAIFFALAGSGGAFAQATYFSKAAATDFGAAASWGVNADGSGAAPGSVSNADNFVIANGSAMDLSSGSSAVRTLTINAGSLTVGSNTLTVAIAAQNNSTLALNTGGTLTVNGTGTLNINGNFSVANGATFNQAGTSNINIDGNNGGAAATSVASGTPIFGIGVGTSVATNTINLTGGTLTIVDPHANTTASDALYLSGTYNGSPNVTTGHTFRFGNGVSTDAGGNVVGFKLQPWVTTSGFRFGNVEINGAAGTNRHVTFGTSFVPFVINGNLTINTGGDLRHTGTSTTSGQIQLNGNLVNNGTMTSLGVMHFADGAFTSGFAISNVASTNAQTVSGTGSFRNVVAPGTSTANFTGVTINNSNAAGVTFSNANSVLSGTNTGTVSGTLLFTSGKITSTAATFILGISGTSAGTLTPTSGGFNAGSTFRRWLTTTTLTTSGTPNPATASHRAFPFVFGSQVRTILMTKSGTWTTGGWIEATHTNAAGLTAAGFVDGVYTVDQRTNASWTLNSGGGINLGVTTLAMGLSGDGLVVLAAAPGAAPRLVQAAAAVKTHIAGGGTSAAPYANRSALVAADLAGPHYIGIATADIGLYSIGSGSWTAPGTWSTGAVPTATDNPLISNGTTVTVSAPSTCLTATVAGTLVVSSSTLDVVGSSGTGISFGGAGTLNVSGGTVNLGPQDNSFCNRNFTIASGATLNVSSGSLNVAGRFVLSSGGNLIQSGGTIKVDGNAGNVSANSVPAGSIVDFTVAAQANLNVTAGNFWIVDPHTLNGTSNHAFGNQTGSNVTCGAGHTFTFGNGNLTDATANTGGFIQETYIGSTRLLYGNLVIDAGNTSPQNLVSQRFTGQFVGVEGNMTITSGNYINSGKLCVAGNLVNNGTLTTTGTLSMSRSSGTGTFVTSTSPSTISGSGTFQNAISSPTASVANFRVQNTHASGVTLSVPLSVSVATTMFEGRLNTTATNLLTLSSSTGNVFTGTTTAGYVSGPVRRIAPASSTNLGFYFPVGQTGPNWFAVYNLTTNAGGPVTIDVTGDNTLNVPNTFDGSLTSIATTREWTTTIVSGAANLTSYSMQGHDNGVASGNALAGIQSPATDFSVLGTGSNYAAAVAPLPPYLTTTLPALAGSTFPDRVSYGNTGPLNVTGATAFQVTGTVSKNSTNNDLTRLVISAVGSSDAVTLTDLVWTYTGSSAADIAANGITLWSGTFTAPTAQIGAGVSLSGGFATFSGLSINIPSGATYLWIRANTAASATIGNVIDGMVETGNLTFATTGSATAAPPIPSADLDPAGNRLIDYCAPTYASGCGSGDDITNVTLGTLNNSSACSGTPFYTYYSAATVPAIQQGSSYTVSVTLGTDGNQYSGVWIDFDQDGVFATTEYFSAGTNAGASGTSSISVTVPGGALTGITRMRVRGGNDAILVNTQACGASSSGFGETEDYRVNITSPSPRALGTITAVQVTGGMGKGTNNNNLLRVEIPTTGSLGTLTLTNMVFNYTGTSNADIAALGASLWTGTVSAPSTQVGSSVSISGGNMTFSGLSVALGANNYLWLRVNTSASATIANLVDARVVTNAITIVDAGGADPAGTQPPSDLDPPGERFIDYCAPTYGSGCGTGDAVTNVTLAGATTTLNNTSACTANPYYTFYNAVSVPDLYQGATYPISVSFGTDGNQWVGVWIDFDQDGLFETTEYFEKNTVTGASGTATFDVVVPPGATLGNTRMRVRGGNDSQLLNTQACGASSSGFGESEDYIVSIIPPPNCSTLLPFPASNTTASTTTVCSGSTVSFNLSVPMPAGTGITYQLRRNATNVGAAVSSLPISVAVTLAGNYDIRVLCNGTPQLTATVVAISVLNPSVTGTTPANRCGPGSLTLAATGSVGTTMKWYSAPTGGAPLASAPSFVTPSLNPGITPYYVSANQIFGTENVGKPSFTPGTGFVTTDWGIVFSALDDITLNSVDIYPDGSGDIVIGLYQSDATTLIAETPAIAISGTLTVQTVPLNFDVPAGSNYRLLVKSYSGITGLGREFAGVAFPYVSPSGAVNVSASEFGGTTTGTYYFFYNLNVSRVCASGRTQVNATVTNPPGLNLTGNTVLCSGESSNLTIGGTGYTTYTWTPMTGVSPAGPGSAKTVAPTVTTTYQITATGPSCNNTRSITVYVRPTPTNPVVVPTPATGLCFGASKLLTTSSTPGGNTLLYSADFDDNTLNGWTVSSGGTSPTNWAVQTAPFSYTTQITNFSVSPTNSPFVMVNSDVLGFGSSDGFADLTSPSISTIGYSGLSLSFDHVYRTTGNNIEASVQYSLDGGFTWSTDIYSATATTPAQAWTATSILTTTQVISLPAAVNNKPNVKFRFRCDYDWDYYWMVDNIQLFVPTQVEYRWSANSAFAGIPVPQQSFDPGNSSVTVLPTAGGTMIYTVEARNNTGCSALVDGTHTTDVSQIVLAPTTTGPQRVGTNLVVSTTATGGFGGYGYQWRKLPDLVTVISSSSSFTPNTPVLPPAAVVHSGTYQITATDGQGCSATATTDALVYDALLWDGSAGDGNWNNPANWTPPIVPATAASCTDIGGVDNVVLTGLGTPPASNPSIFLDNFAVESGVLTLSSNLNVCGSLSGGLVSGKLNGPGTVRLVGTTTSIVGKSLELENLIIDKTGAGSVQFQGVTRINNLMSVVGAPNGITVQPSGNVILTSSATQTGAIGPIPGGVAVSAVNPGKFTMERHIPFTVPEDNDNGQWFFIGSPILNKFFTDFADNFKVIGLTSGFGLQGGNVLPSAQPERSTILKYTESAHGTALDLAQQKGWRIPAALDQIENGRGYRVWIRRYSSNDKFDNQGQIHTGNTTFPLLSRTEPGACETIPYYGSPLVSSPCAEENFGWNLLANPYPAPIDWNSGAWTKPATMNNAFYTWNSAAGAYQAYLGAGGDITSPGLAAGASSNTNPNIIPSSQAFFVKLRDPGSYTASLSVTETAKSVGTPGTFVRTAVDASLVRIRLNKVGLTGYSYDGVVRFDQNSTYGFDMNKDADALSGTQFDYAFIAETGDALVITTVPVLETSKVIPMVMNYRGNNGSFRFNFLEASSMLGNVEAFLKDNYLGTLTSLTETTEYAFDVNSSDASSSQDRFEIVISPASVTSVTDAKSGAFMSLYPNPSAVGANTSVVIRGFEASSVAISVTDVVGRVLSTSVVKLTSGETVHTLSEALPAGVYTVKVEGAGKVLNQKLVIK